MYTISDQIETSFREKGSKFIGYLFPSFQKEDFENKLQEIKSKYPDATHHCFAWRINPHKIEEFVQDDGEPSGTAGLPILNKLKSHNLINCGCIVVRYYGGTNLGKSGLIQAYGYTAERCLSQATLEKIIPTQNFEIIYSYDQQKQIDQLKNSFDLKELNARYLEQVTLKVACRLEQSSDFLASLKELEHLGIDAEPQEKGFVTL